MHPSQFSSVDDRRDWEPPGLMCGDYCFSLKKEFLSKVSGQKKENLPYYKNYTLTEDNSLHGVCINEKYVLTI